MRHLKGAFSVFFLIVLFAGTASAESFSEKFKRFILGPEAEAYSIEHQPVVLERISERCMDCHNGTSARGISVKNAQTPMDIRGMHSVNHPVGMRYDDYALSRPKGYIPKSYLKGKIRFENGKVTCISCHKLKADESEESGSIALYSEAGSNCEASPELTVGPKQTDLCLTCHIQ